uniref:Uncharacterized protein n=1 Tax=Anguilla anguilla TaxID=7936 RepID=A0A0E9P746_ANGAN
MKVIMVEGKPLACMALLLASLLNGPVQTTKIKYWANRSALSWSPNLRFKPP